MNIQDISKMAGVSVATVSRVINNNSNVKEETRQKVLDVMEQYGYVPNAFARGLGLNSMKTIGLLCTDSSDLYQARAINYMERQLREEGYDCILCCTGTKHQNKEKSIKLLLTKKVDGIILISSNFVYESKKDNNYILDVAKEVPVMVLNAEIDGKNVFSVLSDDYESVRKATLKLINSGIKDIIYFYDKQSYSGKRKLAGYRKAMEEKGLLREELMVSFDGKALDNINDMVKCLKDKSNGISFNGIITSDDELAMGAIKYASKNNIKVPEELSIIGFNNSMLSISSNPEMTSIDTKQNVLCSQITKNLISVIAKEEVPKKVIFSGMLVERETTNLK